MGTGGEREGVRDYHSGRTRRTKKGQPRSSARRLRAPQGGFRLPPVDVSRRSPGTVADQTLGVPLWSQWAWSTRVVTAAYETPTKSQACSRAFALQLGVALSTLFVIGAYRGQLFCSACACQGFAPLGKRVLIPVNFLHVARGAGSMNQPVRPLVCRDPRPPRWL